jgi:hypothetical protein
MFPKSYLIYLKLGNEATFILMQNLRQILEYYFVHLIILDHFFIEIFFVLTIIFTTTATYNSRIKV